MILNAHEDEVEKKYKFGRTLGQGTFATVKLAISIEDQKQWAIKIIKRSALTPEDEESLKMELSDAAGAKKQLLSLFEKHSENEFSTKKHMVWDLGDNKLLLATGHDKGVVVQVMGFEKNIIK